MTDKVSRRQEIVDQINMLSKFTHMENTIWFLKKKLDELDDESDMTEK